MESSARAIARHAPDGVVVVEKSTVPAGTAERVRATLMRERPGFRFDVASNPEFLREGTALQDALAAGSDRDRRRVGASRSVLRLLYEPLTDRGHELIETDITTAELAKHASNAFLALKISFANALARLCERAGADVSSVADMMGADPRIGRAFLNAGLGYGGYCFPKDLAAFERLSARLGYPFPLLPRWLVNDEAVEAAVAKVEDALWNLEGKRIAFLGLAFKPDTDDVRFSPALALARRLIGAGRERRGVRPAGRRRTRSKSVPELEHRRATRTRRPEGRHCAWSSRPSGTSSRELDLAKLAERDGLPDRGRRPERCSTRPPW